MKNVMRQFLFGVTMISLLSLPMEAGLAATRKFYLENSLFFTDYTSQELEDENDFYQVVKVCVEEVLQNAEVLPGFPKESADPSFRKTLGKTWEQLCANGFVCCTGEDAQYRPVFVALQGVIEHALTFAMQEWGGYAEAIIHTPMPATPLCTEIALLPGLVSADILRDPLRLLTVTGRIHTVRHYLRQGGVLYSLYPHKGLGKRTPEQKRTYLSELVKNATLFDCPFLEGDFSSQEIGATYFFKGNKSNKIRPCVFSIQMTQAKAPPEKGEFGLWFGHWQNEAIQLRIQQLRPVLQRLKRVL